MFFDILTADFFQNRTFSALRIYIHSKFNKKRPRRTLSARSEDGAILRRPTENVATYFQFTNFSKSRSLSIAGWSSTDFS